MRPLRSLCVVRWSVTDCAQGFSCVNEQAEQRTSCIIPDHCKRGYAKILDRWAESGNILLPRVPRVPGVCQGVTFGRFFGPGAEGPHAQVLPVLPVLPVCHLPPNFLSGGAKLTCIIHDSACNSCLLADDTAGLAAISARCYALQEGAERSASEEPLRGKRRRHA